MPKLNPLALFDVAPRRETREFTDPAQPGQVLTLTLKRLEFPEQMKGAARANELVKAWVKPEDGRQPLPWPPPPQRAIPMSEALCTALAMLEVSQCPDDPEESYDAMELAVISVRMPKAWREIDAWFKEIEEDEPGNASAAREEPSSAPPVIGDAPTPPYIYPLPNASGVLTSSLPDGTASLSHG